MMQQESVQESVNRSKKRQEQRDRLISSYLYDCVVQRHIYTYK